MRQPSSTAADLWFAVVCFVIGAAIMLCAACSSFREGDDASYLYRTVKPCPKLGCVP